MDGRRISSWLPDDPAASQVPREDDADKVLALVKVWSEWAGDGIPNEPYWRGLVKRAQRTPVRPGRPAEPPTAVGRLIAECTDPIDLEVHPAISAETTVQLAQLPAYVPRKHDEELRAVVERAASGESRSAVLVGKSTTGKTRACWEAVHQWLPHDWRLWHPISPGRPEAALEALNRIGPRTVVWLNELQHYLLTTPTGLGESVAAGLRELLRDPARRPVLVLGTIWREPWNTLTADPTREGDPHAQARQLLVNTDIPVPATFDAAALADLRAAADGDPRLAQAYARATGGRITQFLAGVPELLKRYRDAPPAARAVIDAAMDARRLGHGLLLPRALLEAAAPGYLTDEIWNELADDWFAEALRFASQRCRGVPGPLTAVRARPGEQAHGQPHYRLADYLDQKGRTTRQAVPVAKELRDALVAHTEVDDLSRIGYQADSQGFYQWATELYTAAARRGDTGAMQRLAWRLRDAGRLEEALRWCHQAVRTDSSVWETLGSVLTLAGRDEEALKAYQRAAEEAGSIHAMHQVVHMWERSDRTDEALVWLHTLSSDTTVGKRLRGDAAETTGELLERAGKVEEAITFYARAAAEHFGFRPLRGGQLLLWQGRVDDAIAFYQRAIDAGNRFAVREGAQQLASAGRGEDAITWLCALADAGDVDAAIEAAELLERLGRIDEALQLLPNHGRLAWSRARILESAGRMVEAVNEAAASGDFELHGYYLGRAGRTAEALAVYQPAAERGSGFALDQAARLFQHTGRFDEGAGWLEERAKAGASAGLALEKAAALLGLGGRIEDALTYYRRASDAGQSFALEAAGKLLEELGQIDLAVEWLQACAESGAANALRPAADILERAGRTDEAERLRRFGWASDNSSRSLQD